MKFKFRLDPVLRNRKIQQDLAQKDYLEAERAVTAQLQYIKQLYSEMDDAREDIATIQNAGGHQTFRLQFLEDFIEGQKVRIKSERDKARELMRIKEDKFDILVEKSKDFKVIEKLKENQATTFRKEKSMREQKAADDMTVMRFDREVDHE